MSGGLSYFLVYMLLVLVLSTRDGDAKGKSTIKKLVNRLSLKPHPQGGYYTETYRGHSQVYVAGRSHMNKNRAVGTSIYYLLGTEDISAWRKVKDDDEVIYWHAGGGLKVHTIDSAGNLKTIVLCDVLKKETCSYEATINHDLWVAMEPTRKTNFVLVGAASFPGFEFEDWELGKEEQLVKQYPQHESIIRRLSKA